MDMQRIVIKNFGPISNAEIDIKKAVILIGENATGKSTIIKVISTFLWIEKALFRGTEKKWFEKENRLKTALLPYHRIENFLKNDTVIEYYGNAYTIKYAKNKISIENQFENNYLLPQIMYVPAERNFLTYLRTTKELKSEGALQDFEREHFNAANNLNGTLSLPINDFEIEYNKRHEMLYVKTKNYKIKITEAASGLQSSVPLYLVSDYLSKLVQNNGTNEVMTSGDIRDFEKEVSKILSDKNLTEKQKQITISKISALSKKFNKKAFINIIEEPEQNLFPVSQMQMIKSLVSMSNQNEYNKIIISTHSPYILATINNLMLANKVGQIYPDKVSSKVSKELWLNCSDVFAGIVKNGTVEEMIDTDLDMIQVEQLDAVSQVINEEFDFLYQYETSMINV
ncbi:MAG: ATP-binding protein [Bacteroidales bacterium]|jgi:predicted ATPase|nr:ATP-binding protein [Bacteroidales bacterium]